MFNIADHLRSLGAVLCAACNRWTYREASAPCPFCTPGDPR